MGDRKDMTIMIRDVPTAVHKRFRIWCFENEISMNAQLLSLLKEFVAKEGDVPRDADGNPIFAEDIDK